MSNDSKDAFLGSTDWLVSAVKKNPEGLLLLAAGCALLLRNKRSPGSSQHHRSLHPGGGERGSRRRGSDRGGDWDLAEGMSRTADKAREYATTVSDTVSETAEEYVSAAGEYVDDARRMIVKQSGRMADQAQGAIERISREQPLAVAIAGLAAGAAIAAAFPTTRFEREALGEAGKTLSDAASSAGERLSRAASAAGEQLKEAAEEKGLNKEGIKEVASGVVDAFGKTVTGDTKEHQSPSSAQPSVGKGNRQGSVVPPTADRSAASQRPSTEPGAPRAGAKLHTER